MKRLDSVARFLTVVTTSVVLLLGCWPCEREPVPEGAAIIAMGDSVMAWSREDGAAIPDVVARELDRVVYNASISGAYFNGESCEGIRWQWVERDWEWLVFNGGANDLNDRCGCGECAAVMDGIISAGGTNGTMPEFVRSAADGGTRVVILGYYHVPPTADYGFDRCIDGITELSRRQSLLADSHADVWFVDGTTIFDPADLANYDDDHAHPSPLGSERLGQAIAAAIAAAD